MINVRIMFLVLSVVTTFNCNDVSAANSNNQIEILLETIIQKVDLLERNIENVRSDVDNVNTVVSKVEFKVDDFFKSFPIRGGAQRVPLIFFINYNNNNVYNNV